MNTKEFETKFKELFIKSDMFGSVGNYIVFDVDDDGHVYVDYAGDVYFANSNRQWVKSHLNISNVVSMKFYKYYFEETLDAEFPDLEWAGIVLSFSEGDRLLFESDFNRYDEIVRWYAVAVDENVEIINKFAAECSGIKIRMATSFEEYDTELCVVRKE